MLQRAASQTHVDLDSEQVALDLGDLSLFMLIFKTFDRTHQLS